jgi:tyrosine decarboxylase/aspartate 1-decarboxylase
MRVKGLSEEEVQEKLNQALARDMKYKDGKIFCSMCTSPHFAAKYANQLFVDSNLGDPGLFSGTANLEKEAVAELGALLHGKTSVGYIVSGGTEANLLAMYSAREKAAIMKPEVIVPESAHFSFNKICNMLKIKLVHARLDNSFIVNALHVEELVNKNTVAIVGTAGSVELGTIDPINKLSKIALDRDIPLHVDAAFGGLVIPFLKELGYPMPDFDFTLEGVQSVTVDPHKMGMSTVPAGGILFRDNNILECLKTPTPYLTEPYQCTFVGTRSGGSVAAVWAVFASQGREGFKKTVAHCMELTTFLYEGLEEAGFEVLLRPTMNILAFRSTNAKVLVDKLRQNGWYVSYVPRLNCVRVVLMPHSTKQHLTNFLKCLKELEPR